MIVMFWSKKQSYTRLLRKLVQTLHKLSQNLPLALWMQKIYILCFLVWSYIPSLQGQYKEVFKQSVADSLAKQSQKLKSSSKFQNWFKGGNFSMQFAPLSVDISPAIFYRIHPRLQVGGGISYIYTRVAQGDSISHLNIYGGRLLLQPRLSDYFFLQAEYEALNIRSQVQQKRLWLHNPQVGGGIAYPLGGQLSINMTLLYNLNYDPNHAPFPSPWRLRVGFSF